MEVFAITEVDGVRVVEFDYEYAEVTMLGSSHINRRQDGTIDSYQFNSEADDNA